MIKYVLILWLGTTDNFTDYSEFKTMKECEAKKEQITKALRQANSELKVQCRVRYEVKK